MAADGNRVFFDDTVRYQIFLERYKNGQVRRIRDFLIDLDIDLTAQIEARLERMTAAEVASVGRAGNATTQRLKGLREYLAEIRVAAETEIRERILEENLPIAERKVNRSVNAARVAAEIEVARPSISQIETALRSQPFEGQVLKEWVSDWSQARSRRVTQALRVGIALGESPSNIAKRLRGTKSKGYRDGVLEVSRRSAQTIARTANKHVSAVADVEIARRNKQHIKHFVRTAVLDSRTSETCRVNDGRVYEIEEAAGVIPAHPNCRTMMVPVFRDQGDTPADQRFGDWLSRQSRAVQEESLGASRAKLLRDGGLKYDDLVNQATRQEYTLAELAAREAKAFERAGL